MKAIVIGATGGIGRAMAQAIEARGGDVVRLSRTSSPPLDLADDRSIESAAAIVGAKGAFDLIFLATGLLHRPDVTPEKSMRAIEGPALDDYFRVNATGPALVMRRFLPLLARDRPATFAALSARVGSIGDNRLGGWVGYRASKAALNQIVRTLAIELARTAPLASLVSLHPGTVDTPLSAPFQRGVAPERLFAPATAAAQLIAVIERLTPADSGGCFDWRGEPIPP
jgi:NAD(P)-dependent dehydrogenase (short-subunit alcohol dehydrogenase family)